MQNKSAELAFAMRLIMKLKDERINSNRDSIAFIAIMGRPGISSDDLARICNVEKRFGWAAGNRLVKAGLAEARDIEKAESIRGRRNAGFHLTEKGKSLIK